MDKYLWERIQIFLLRSELLSLRSASNFLASCEWYGHLNSCALTACQRTSSSIDGRVLRPAGTIAEFALTTKESHQALVRSGQSKGQVGEVEGHPLERTLYSAVRSLLGGCL